MVPAFVHSNKMPDPPKWEDYDRLNHKPKKEIKELPYQYQWL